LTSSFALSDGVSSVVRGRTYDRAVTRQPPPYLLMDLFAGCGGMTRGFIDTGRFRPVFAVEADADAAFTYGENFGHEHVEPTRIEDIDSFPSVDVVVGGPPCQGFSTLNRHLVGFDRRGLWRWYVRALQQADAAAFVMENVPQLLDSNEYRQFKQHAARLGYSVEERVLNAADFGVPQQRRRAIVIGTKAGSTAWPQATHSDPERSAVGTRPWRTFYDAVHDLPLQPDGRNWHVGRNPRPETIRRYQAVPQDGGNRFQMQENLDRAGLGQLVLPCFRRKPTGTTDVFGRLWWARPAVTIRTEFHKPEKGRYLHPTEDRPITLREGARCMSFPDDFVFPVTQSMTSVARQIGNAVPPLLAREIAEAVATALDEVRAASSTQAA
jgi:DNA (cytosine-5)-methyltransferase 1